jgi:hypothetical protein
MASRKAILGIVDNHEQAGNVVAELRLHGFPADIMSVLFLFSIDRAMGDAARASAPEARADGPSADEVAFFSNACALTLPRVGRVIAAGAVVTSLLRGARDLAHCFDEAGVTALEMAQYERDIRNGGILIGVHIDHPEVIAFVKDVFARYGVTSVVSREEVTVSYRLRRGPSSSETVTASR